MSSPPVLHWSVYFHVKDCENPTLAMYVVGHDPGVILFFATEYLLMGGIDLA